jgi:hypothetical protein
MYVAAGKKNLEERGDESKGSRRTKSENRGKATTVEGDSLAEQDRRVREDNRPLEDKCLLSLSQL